MYITTFTSPFLSYYIYSVSVMLGICMVTSNFTDYGLLTSAFLWFVIIIIIGLIIVFIPILVIIIIFIIPWAREKGPWAVHLTLDRLKLGPG